MFSHLHTHSHFSLLAGIPSPTQLAERAARLGMPALALTDHDRLTGAIEFYDACRGAGVQPIIGLEIPVRFSPRWKDNLVFLAQDLPGWTSLCCLSSLLLDGADGAAEALTLDTLQQNSTGLLCLTGAGGWTANGVKATVDADELTPFSVLGRLHEIFKDCLYLEMQAVHPDGAGMAALARLSQQTRIPLVGTGSVYYLDPEQHRLQELLSAIRLNTPLSALPPGASAPQGSWMAGAEDMEARFAHYPAALAGVQEVLERCRLELPLGKQVYPRIHLADGKTPLESLREKAFSGAGRLYGEITPEIWARLEHELSVIESSGYASLFLIMEEVIQFARQADVPYSSRGSAGSSLVAHCLGITSPDPLRLDLYFERFLNPERCTPPDIDTDLCSNHRDEVIRHVYDQYGADQVAMVCTINRFRPRSALRETAKAHGLSSSEIDQMVRALPSRWGPPREEERDEETNLPESFAPLWERFTSPRFRRVIEDAGMLLGIPDHLSVHPGGVVISPGRMHEIAPTQAAEKGIRTIQFDLDQVERLGLVKMDLLGTRGLSVLGDVADKMRIANYSSNKIAFLETIPNEDKAVSELIRTGRTVGCFGIESPGMQHTLREIQASTPDDLMVALSLYRPGPMTGGLKDAFVNRHLGKEAVEHLHPALSRLLAETYGVILYQEQVLRIAHELAGFTLAEADLLRRAMSHFDPGERMKTLRDRFIDGAGRLSGVPAETAVRIWEMMAAFAGYGFPKAHAASYAQVAWRSAYCKVHHPAEFLAAVLANWGGYYRQDVYLLEARRMGLNVRGPHVNHSEIQFSAVDLDGSLVLFMGLDQVRELTRGTQQRILRERPFTSFGDFLARVAPRPKEAEHLVRVNALEGLGSIPVLLKQIGSNSRRMGQMELFQQLEEDRDAADWTLEEKAAAQQELLGIAVIAHPLELVQEQFSHLNVMPVREARQQIGRTVRIGGLRQSWRKQKGSRISPTSGAVFHTVLDDLTDGMHILVSETVYNSHREILSRHDPLVVEGKVHRDRQVGEPVLIVQRLILMDTVR